MSGDLFSGYETALVYVQPARRGDPVRSAGGRLVLPGLAVVPATGSPTDDSLSLVHVRSGLKVPLGVPTARCPIHMAQAVETIQRRSPELGVDWDVPKDALMPDRGSPESQRVIGLVNEATAAVGRKPCRLRRCGEDVPTWLARCTTCGAVWDDEEDGPIDEAQAREWGDEHECTPRIQIRPPGDDTEWADAGDQDGDDW